MESRNHEIKESWRREEEPGRCDAVGVTPWLVPIRCFAEGHLSSSEESSRHDSFPFDPFVIMTPAEMLLLLFLSATPEKTSVFKSKKIRGGFLMYVISMF